MSATRTGNRMLSDEDRASLLALIEGADSVELKLTVPEADHVSAVASLGIDPLDAQIRQVFFFDTPDLTLNAHGVVVRARRVQMKGDDSVVKLRPVVPAELPARMRRSPAFGVEVDAMPGGFVCSGSMKGAPTDVRETLIRKRPLRGLSRRSSGRSTTSMPRRASGSTTWRSWARSSCSSSSGSRRASAASSSPRCGSIRTTRGSSSSRPSLHRPRRSRSPRRRGRSCSSTGSISTASRRRRRGRRSSSSPSD